MTTPDNRALWELVDAKFRSGNSIPVERIVITRAEYEAILERPVVVGDVQPVAWRYRPLDEPYGWTSILSKARAYALESSGFYFVEPLYTEEVLVRLAEAENRIETDGKLIEHLSKPINVSDEMVERYVNAVNAYLGSLTPKDWEIERFDLTASIARVARIGLTAALESMVRGKS